MIKHIVLFQLTNELSESQILEISEQFKCGIESLASVINCIKRISVGININPNEAYHLCLESEFQNMEDLKEYATHPAHLKWAAFIKPHVVCRSCVDYEL